MVKLGIQASIAAGSSSNLAQSRQVNSFRVGAFNAVFSSSARTAWGKGSGNSIVNAGGEAGNY